MHQDNLQDFLTDLSADQLHQQTKTPPPRKISHGGNKPCIARGYVTPMQVIALANLGGYKYDF